MMMTITIPETCYDRIEMAIRSSLGLTEGEHIALDVPFEKLDESVEPIDYFEVLQAVGVPSIRLKPYFYSGGLTQKGVLFLERVSDYITHRRCGNNDVTVLNTLKDARNLETLAQSATMRSILYLRSYLEHKHILIQTR